MLHFSVLRFCRTANAHKLSKQRRVGPPYLTKPAIGGVVLVTNASLKMCDSPAFANLLSYGTTLVALLQRRRSHSRARCSNSRGGWKTNLGPLAQSNWTVCMRLLLRGSHVTPCHPLKGFARNFEFWSFSAIRLCWHSTI